MSILSILEFPDPRLRESIRLGRYEEFAEASEDAWRRVLEFLETHSA